MTKEIRQGLGLTLIGVVVLLVGLVAGASQAGNVVRVAGFLFLIGGLITAAVGFFRAPQRD